MKTIVMNVLSNLKQRVIMKWEVDLEDAPSNVMVKKWLPVQDILGNDFH